MEYIQSFFGYSAAPAAHKIVAFGNVLLDYAVQLSPTQTNLELFERYKIIPGSKGELDAETLSKITAEASECTDNDCVKNPGGSALNTVRILKRLGTDALFFGAVGVDKPAEELRNILKERGIAARLHAINDVPTGQCICLVFGDNATLYANIGASAKLTIDDVKAAEHDTAMPLLRPIERKQIIYIEGFFVPHREPVCEYIIKNYIRERRRLALNLSAVYIVRENYEQILNLARHAFFIFGNLTEFQALMEQMNCKSLDEMSAALIQKEVAKIIVITNGADAVQVITNYVDEYAQPDADACFQNYNVSRVQEVVDPTGAGDSFVAGFLHAWLEKRALSECVRVASELAAIVCTQIGCNLAETI